MYNLPPTCENLKCIGGGAKWSSSATKAFECVRVRDFFGNDAAISRPFFEIPNCVNEPREHILNRNYAGILCAADWLKQMLEILVFGAN
jgi:hypothetical protein